jgi:Ala-tRNA(Pro) deacylase
MSIPTHLKSHLRQAHITYLPILHIPTRRAQYMASILHVPGKEVAKTVVFRAGEKHLLAVLPASYHVNLKKLAAAVGAPVRLIDELECNELFPDCDAGAIPPFGELYGLSVYMDEALADNPEIVFSAGTRSDAIRIGNADFVHLAKARVCSFADRP